MIAQALENLGRNLGKDPIKASQEIYSNALAKLNDKQMAVKYLAPYMKRIAAQHNKETKLKAKGQKLKPRTTAKGHGEGHKAA